MVFNILIQAVYDFKLDTIGRHFKRLNSTYIQVGAYQHPFNGIHKEFPGLDFLRTRFHNLVPPHPLKSVPLIS
jgi:hypothetical protein